MELKELLLIGTNGGWYGRRDDRCLQVCGRLDGFCSAVDKKLVVNVLRGEGMQGEARIAPNIRTLR